MHPVALSKIESGDTFGDNCICCTNQIAQGSKLDLNIISDCQSASKYLGAKA